MYIENQLYRTDLTEVNSLRYLLFTNFYSNPGYIENLKGIIAKHIECLSMEYDPIRYTFTVKIKKTAMRKYYGFNHDPNFYHQLISDVFKEFVTTHEQDIISCAIKSGYQNPAFDLRILYDNPYIMANLCHVSCMADNILVIKL